VNEERKKCERSEKRKRRKGKENFPFLCAIHTEKSLSIPHLYPTTTTHIHIAQTNTLSEFFTHAKVGNSMKIVCVIFAPVDLLFPRASIRNDMNRKL
jgi:hypothetical protein